jgi:hypothetical protein
LYIPLHQLSKLFPPPWQFVPAIYVAVTKEQLHGLIWLTPEGRGALRWKIDQLILDPNSFSYDIGTQLINFVINRYGAEGVQTFLATVDQASDQALGLFKSCGFRHCSRMHYFQLDNVGSASLEAETLHHTRHSSACDANKLQELFNEGLPPEVRLSLEKAPRDFRRPFFQQMGARISGQFHKRWVVDDVARDRFLASVELISEDYKHFTLSFLVHPGWSHLLPPVLHFGLEQIKRHTTNASVSIEAYDFEKDKIALLESVGFGRAGTAEILVKDYWIPIQEAKPRLDSPILLFKGKTSPA